MEMNISAPFKPDSAAGFIAGVESAMASGGIEEE